MTKDEINNILKENPEILNKMIRQKIKEDESNQIGKIIYKNLTDIYIDKMDSLNTEEDELLSGILDAMTGYCAKPCWIGTGNYHIIS